MQYVPFAKETKNGQTKADQLPDMLHTTLSGIAAGSQAIGIVSIEYSFFDSSRTGTIYGNPHSKGRKPVTFVWLFGFYNAWLLTHTESQACTHSECARLTDCHCKNWWTSGNRTPSAMPKHHVELL